MRITSRIVFMCAVVSIAFAAFYNTGCNTKNGINLDISKDAFTNLSDYNLFKGNMADLVPNGNLLPYNLITPLFSDYAEKARFVWVPEGKQATYSADGVLDLPVGSLLVKNFFYTNTPGQPAKGKRIVETRLLIHRESGWDAETYVWNADQTEAKREIAGQQVPITFTNPQNEKVTINYIVPNKNQCGGCHEYAGKIQPIGIKVRNLNMNYTYTDGTKNQLLKWQDASFLAGVPDVEKAPRIPVWNDAHSGTLDDRARGWLDINCAHCHNPRGPAKNSGLDLSYTNRDSLSFGIGKAPVAAGAGAGNNMIDIDPGRPDNSILIYRLASTNPEVMMPELGRTIVHTESLSLIKDWVVSLNPHPVAER